MVAYVHERTSIDGWHKCLGHPSIKVVQNLVNLFSLPLTTNKHVTFDELQNPTLQNITHGPSSIESPPANPHFFLKQNPCPNSSSSAPSIPATSRSPDCSSQPPPSSDHVAVISVPPPGISSSTSTLFHCESHDNHSDMNLNLNLDAGLNITTPHDSLSNQLASTSIPDSQCPVQTESPST
ncbi:hypothetical protein Patl1_07395 [Pistacia atlantica]|uniref:Uncharacterized protein n=1 Tax=Pistacia atlantica TaxID=434234 RepID=A0ACC1AKR9_9ROSI|nr:hypothetical protein Patl1_07395 [Pistacia atlantica]